MLFLGVAVLFNLLTPAGRVLLRIGGVAVTEGALTVGAGKAASLGGLMFLSRLMVDSRLRLPGAAGALLASSLAFLARLMDGRVRFDLRHPARSLDRALLSAQGRRARSATGRRRFRHDDAAGRDVCGRAACARRRSTRLEPPPRLIRDGFRLCGTLSPRRAERCRERERRRDAGSREAGATAGRGSPAQAGKAAAGDLHGSRRAPGGVAACPGSRGAVAGEPSRGGSGEPAVRPHQRPSDAGAARSGGCGQAGGRGRGRRLPRSAARLRRGDRGAIRVCAGWRLR